jgi:hypothetical protein
MNLTNFSSTAAQLLNTRAPPAQIPTCKTFCLFVNLFSTNSSSTAQWFFPALTLKLGGDKQKGQQDGILWVGNQSSQNDHALPALYPQPSFFSSGKSVRTN